MVFLDDWPSIGHYLHATIFEPENLFGMIKKRIQAGLQEDWPRILSTVNTSLKMEEIRGPGNKFYYAQEKTEYKTHVLAISVKVLPFCMVESFTLC